MKWKGCYYVTIYGLDTFLNKHFLTRATNGVTVKFIHKFLSQNVYNPVEKQVSDHFLIATFAIAKLNCWVQLEFLDYIIKCFFYQYVWLYVILKDCKSNLMNKALKRKNNKSESEN